MFIENLISILLISTLLIAIGSIALVQIIYGRTDIRLTMNTFVLISLGVSTLSLKWLEGNGQIHSNQDNTSIFLFICLLLTLSLLVTRRRKRL